MTVAAESLREALLEQARIDADRALAHADEQVAFKLRDAEERGRALVERARADGIAAASIVGSHEEAWARRRARALVLAARLELYEELQRQARAASHALRRDPGYRFLLDRLIGAARAQLGEDAVLEVDPPREGGVRASNGARRVDFTLDALADRCLERLGGAAEWLWK